MLVEFTVANFRSIRDAQTFSMEATKLRSSARHRDAHEGNVFESETKLRLLTAAAIYGANASGKSNLIKGLGFMRGFVLNSSREGLARQAIRVEPFLLTDETEKAPSHFEVVFRIEGRRFRYGFEVDKQRVFSEWLFEMGAKSEKVLFTREEQIIKTSSSNFAEGRGLKTRARENALFLSVCVQFNGAISGLVSRWFEQLSIASGLFDHHFGGQSIDDMDDQAKAEEIIAFMKRLDVGINGVVLTKNPMDAEFIKVLPAEIQEQLQSGEGMMIEVETLHHKYNSEGQTIGQVRFDLNKNESDGTQKMFHLAGSLLKTLREGATMVVDELDARLHPLLTCAIIGLFGDRTSNPHGAQLLFTTHDTNLLSNSLFRRDQIWFAEKDGAQGTNFYSLAEFPVRYDSDLETAYVRGKFGAIPYLGDLREVAADAESQTNGKTPEPALHLGDE